MTTPADAIEAVTHADPYLYYSSLPPLAFDRRLGLWVAAGERAVEAALRHASLGVRPPGDRVPRALAGRPAGELFGGLARQTDGAAHAARRAGVLARLESLQAALDAAAAREARALAGALATLDGRAVDSFAVALPARALGALLGVAAGELPRLPALAGALVRGFAASATAGELDAADAAALALRALIPPAPAIDAANAVGLFTQAHDATAALIGNLLVALARGAQDRLDELAARVLRDDPPVHNTRRFALAPCELLGQPLQPGECVLVVLASARRTFGLGVHECPGQRSAAQIATAGVRALLDAGLQPRLLLPSLRYRALPNVRAPLFGAADGETAPQS